VKVVIVGAGEVGFHVADHLALENKDVVVIDKDPAAIRGFKTPRLFLRSPTATKPIWWPVWWPT
jgi:Trk K+ transport system NAD-binding subunit